MLIFRVLMALVLPCAGMVVVFLVYMWILWLSTRREVEPVLPEKAPAAKGLTVAELEKLPREERGPAAACAECAVCLDDIERGQSVRLLPPCRHAFHLACVDRWLSHNPFCPVCRAPLGTSQSESPQFPTTTHLDR